jgi:hypothetical protein
MPWIIVNPTFKAHLATPGEQSSDDLLDSLVAFVPQDEWAKLTNEEKRDINYGRADVREYISDVEFRTIRATRDVIEQAGGPTQFAFFTIRYWESLGVYQ